MTLLAIVLLVTCEASLDAMDRTMMDWMLF